MKKIIVLFVILLVITSVSGSMLDEAMQLQDKIMNFIEEDNTILVKGSHISSSEKITLFFLQSQFPEIKEIEVVLDKDFQESDNVIVLLGGPSQNLLASQYLNDPSFAKEEDELSFGRVTYLTSNTKKVLIFSDHAGYDNVARTNHINSPLTNFVPIEYVPVVATGLTFSLIWLWHFFGGMISKMIKTFLARFLLKKVKSKKEIIEEYHGIEIFGLKLKSREWISIFSAAIIFSLAITYSYFTKGMDLWNFVLINIVVNLAIYTIRNLVKLFMDKQHNTHTEYHFWLVGAFLTLLSTWLGNTFSLAGFNVSKKGENVGKAKYFVNLLTFFAGLIFFVWNLFKPSIITQMSTILLVSVGVLRMLPIEPMGGEKIWKWNKFVWLITFIPLFVFYILISLIV